MICEMISSRHATREFSQQRQRVSGECHWIFKEDEHQSVRTGKTVESGVMQSAGKSSAYSCSSRVFSTRMSGNLDAQLAAGGEKTT
jgi:hypothetical protein